MRSHYYLNPEMYSLAKFQKSLDSRELIPSRQILKEKLHQRLNRLHQMGLKNLADLLSALGSNAKIVDFAQRSGISANYLTLLRREANSYFPSPVNLSRFEGVDESVVSVLEAAGIRTSKKLYELVADADQLSAFLSLNTLEENQLSKVISLADLSRLYGVGPTFAAMLFDAGIDSVRSIMRYSGDEIRSMYEEKTQKTADFTARDIDFTLEIARELEALK